MRKPAANTFEVTQGSGPLILGLPHGGTHVPDDIFSRLNVRGQGLADTDWHILRLYQGLDQGLDQGMADSATRVTRVSSNIHRYVIDANRDPAGASLYPGQNTTALCPTTDFNGQPIWREGQEPDTDEILARCEKFHAPYHRALAEQIARVKERHGVAVLFDCHSICSQISFLFDGRLPDFNIGTNNTSTCGQSVEKIVAETCARADKYTSVLNGRFKGGWTTRHYGRPGQNVHGVQLELAQRTYMDEKPPWTYRADRAADVRKILAQILDQLDQLARLDRLAGAGSLKTDTA